MKPTAHRVISVYLALVASAVALQFTLWRVWSQASDRAEQTSDAIWQVLGWGQLIALALTLVVTFGAKRKQDTDPAADTRGWLNANILFYCAVVLSLAFLPIWLAANWGKALPEDAFWLVWYIINTAGPVVFAIAALRLWRSTPAAE